MPDLWMDVDAALSEVPVNIMPLLDDTDFKSIEAAIAYNAAGMALNWHFVTTAGAYTVTAVTPTTGGNYDWTDQGTAGIYTIEIPASGGASINNDTEGFGWFTGVCTGVLPWRGPTIGFRAAALNNSMIDGTTIDVNVTAMAANVVTAAAINDGAIDAATFAAGAINAAAIANGAIDNATFAADVGSTAYATNIIALAADKAIVNYGALKPTTASRTLDVTATGAAGIDWGNVENLTTANALTNTVIASVGAALSVSAINASVIMFADEQSLEDKLPAVLADTNELQTDWVNGGRLDLILDARASQTSVDDLPTNAELATALAAADDAVLAAVAALNNLSAAQVNAEVVDALATDTYAEPSGAPAATASLAAKLNRIYQVLRNSVTVTASAKTFLDDGGSALWSKGLSDDGTTYTEAEGS